MQKTLSELKKIVNEHFYNEAKIMKNEIIESKISKEENKELKEFMLNHPRLFLYFS
jgi:uncharacterized membrane protein